MRPQIKYFLVSFVLVLAYLGYLYSQKVFVEGKQVKCSFIEDRFANGLENAFDYKYSCSVTFNIINLTSNPVKASYEVTNIDISHGSRSRTRTVQYGAEATDSVELIPRETKSIKVIVGSNFDHATMKVKAWSID